MSIAGEYVGPDPTATFSGDISVSTVAQATGTLVAGDIIVSLGSAFKAVLESVVGNANAACNLAKRDPAATCVINFMKSQAKQQLDYPLLDAVPDILQHVVDGSLELVKLPATKLGEIASGGLIANEPNERVCRWSLLSSQTEQHQSMSLLILP